MDNNTQGSVVIFGGSGFIGTHMSRYLLENSLADKIYCADLAAPRYKSPKLEYVYCDVRKPIRMDTLSISTIYNFAAIHTTPGHADTEYFETNILGARNVCDFAGKMSVNTVIFTSSISPYGPSEDVKHEDDLPQPSSAYGSSKLTAEYIHRCWQAGDPTRKLIIVRPGVVFGHGEGGNITRLYKSLKNGYFFYPGRKDTKKACIYVKDLVMALYGMSNSKNGVQFYNMCYKEAPSIEVIVKVVSEVTHVRNVGIGIPGFLLIWIARLISFTTSLVGIKNGIHPDRVKKLMMSTNISGERLANSPFAIRYTLQEAIEDWYEDCSYKGLD